MQRHNYKNNSHSHTDMQCVRVCVCVHLHLGVYSLYNYQVRKIQESYKMFVHDNYGSPACFVCEFIICGICSIGINLFARVYRQPRKQQVCGKQREFKKEKHDTFRGGKSCVDF